MKMYLKFLKRGLAYGKELVLVFCAAFYLVYTTPPDTPLLSSGKNGGFAQMKRHEKAISRGKKFALPGASGAFAI